MSAYSAVVRRGGGFKTPALSPPQTELRVSEQKVSFNARARPRDNLGGLSAGKSRYRQATHWVCVQRATDQATASVPQWFHPLLADG